MSFLSYCEFRISCIVYLPTYIIASILVSQAETEGVVSARTELSEEWLYILPSGITTILNMNRILSIAASLIIACYLRQMDVSLLIIKKWAIS